jgi:hypothetical protein
MERRRIKREQSALGDSRVLDPVLANRGPAPLRSGDDGRPIRQNRDVVFADERLAGMQADAAASEIASPGEVPQYALTPLVVGR